MNVDPVRKDPNTAENFGIDWSTRPLGVLTISASVWEAPAGITIDDDAFTTTTTTVKISGGTDGEDYTLTNTVTLSDTQTSIAVLPVQIRTVQSWGLSDAQLVILSEITLETLETVTELSEDLNGSQVAKLIADIELWSANCDDVDMKINAEGVRLEAQWLLDAIRERTRKTLGLPLYSFETHPGSVAIPVRAY